MNDERYQPGIFTLNSGMEGYPPIFTGYNIIGKQTIFYFEQWENANASVAWNEQILKNTTNKNYQFFYITHSIIKRYIFLFAFFRSWRK